ncbi:MAG TPA: glutamine--fructose-6-phosphate transaminase (isomerizing) [Chloroflexi bacterium]|nr:MAG: glutamine--fructose-6-phosphate transaminase (isomerizing) [Chloroflexota bacterium]HDD54770.1 glutamine--fructose-6-phosphate transaminase (isomerizing) [Chloroflexota bacterium]
MCGIFGIVTREITELGPILVGAGERLSYRGYDTVGAATLPREGEIDLRKDAGKVQEVAEKYNFAEMTGDRAILQLRWATFGAPSKINSQPHLDSDGDLVGAHNGNVVNNVELREEFQAEGMVVRSENDGESCVHAVERYVDQGYEMVEAIRMATLDLEGDYSFVIGKVGEDHLYAIKMGSGLVAGIREDMVCIGSDLPSILPLTREIVRLYDGEIISFWAGGYEITSVEDGSTIERDPEIVEDSMEAAQKGGYPHFMLKEIHEQSQVAGELLDMLDKIPEVDQFIEKLEGARDIYVIACGTSYHAGLLGSIYLNKFAGRSAIPVLAPQFAAQYGNAVGPEDVGIFITQSGETKDVINAVDAARERGMGVLDLVNVVGSTLTLISDVHLPLVCGYEISVPATKTYLNQVLALLYIALRWGGHDTTPLRKIPGLINLTLEKTEEQIKPLVEKLDGWDDLYSLGYGLTFPVALEGALKFKEITYAHCEGMLSTEFKHGPLSAVYDGYPVIFTAGPEDIPLIVSGINEVTCRGGHVIAIGLEDPRLKANAQQILTIPWPDLPEELVPAAAALLSAVPLQLLSYHCSLARGYDPDFPRNLSKTLTVD